MHKRVKVCIRVRPASKDHAGIRVNEQEKTISVMNEANGNGTCFHFDDVLGSNATQEQVYQIAASEAAQSVLTGYNGIDKLSGTVMAYGQTGAGKTFTMSGGKTSFADRGICARSIASLFQGIQGDTEHKYSIRVSYVEIYNEQLYDLLDFSEEGKHKDLVVQENDKGQTFVKGLSKPLVDNEGAALDYLFQGETNRTIAEHCLNNASTRSHCIFSLHVDKRPLEDSKGPTVSSKLNLVDLAGSERMKKTQVTGTMLKETTHINKSLTFLEQVVIALGDQKREHIPYRQTTLTNILKDSLGGNCRTLLIACVWPDESQNDQTIATLKFATRMMRVKTSAVVNVTQEQSQNVKKYQDEIKRLKHELALHDTLAGKSHVVYDEMSAEQEEEMRQSIELYIADPSKTLQIVNIIQIQTLYRLFREICLSRQQTIRDAIPEEPEHETTAQSNQNETISTVIEETPEDAKQDEELMEKFKQHIAIQMEETKQNFRKAKKRVVQCANDVNIAKSEIDAISRELVVEGIDEEKQQELVIQLKEAKRKYRNTFEHLNNAKAEMNYLKNIKEQLINNSLNNFQIW